MTPDSPGLTSKNSFLQNAEKFFAAALAKQAVEKPEHSVFIRVLSTLRPGSVKAKIAGS
jgi:hypothetical protein